MGLGTLWTVLFFFNMFLLTTKVFFSENNYITWVNEYKKDFNSISNNLFFFLFIILFLGYCYDIIYRTNKGQLKKFKESDKINQAKIQKHASIGALLGLLLTRLFVPGELFISIIMIFFSYILMFFVPRTFMFMYLKIRFPNTFLRHK